jgi:hypothetical protein
MSLDGWKLARMHTADVDHPVIGFRHATEKRLATSGSFLVEICQCGGDLHGPYRVTCVLEEHISCLGAAGRGEAPNGFDRGGADDYLSAGSTAVRIG